MAINAPLLDLPDVSLLCVETRRPHLALYALRRCLQQARFGEVRLLGSQPCGLPLPPQVQEVRIRELNAIEDYLRFMLRELGDYFSLGHVLVVQWMGMAPSPMARVGRPHCSTTAMWARHGQDHPQW